MMALVVVVGSFCAEAMRLRRTRRTKVVGVVYCIVHVLCEVLGEVMLFAVVDEAQSVDMVDEETA